MRRRRRVDVWCGYCWRDYPSFQAYQEHPCVNPASTERVSGTIPSTTGDRLAADVRATPRLWFRG